MKPPKSPSRPFAEQLRDVVRAGWPDMHVLILAVHPSVPENCSLAASNMPKWLAAKLMREQADGLEAELNAESAELSEPVREGGPPLGASGTERR